MVQDNCLSRSRSSVRLWYAVQTKAFSAAVEGETLCDYSLNVWRIWRFLAGQMTPTTQQTGRKRNLLFLCSAMFFTLWGWFLRNPRFLAAAMWASYSPSMFLFHRCCSFHYFLFQGIIRCPCFYFIGAIRCPCFYFYGCLWPQFMTSVHRLATWP